MIRWHTIDTGSLEAIAYTAVIAGYMFFIDISDRVWWSESQIKSRRWDYLSIRPTRHAVSFSDITKVETALHPANVALGKPFDRVLFISPTDTVVVLPSFNRREELEELLRIVRDRRPDADYATGVVEFMQGAFAEWWHHR